MPLFALGSNSSGQLGLGHREDVNSPKEAKLSTTGNEYAQPIKVAAGGNHSLILMSDGKILAAGENKDGRCGFASLQPSPQTTFAPVIKEVGMALSKIKLCAATWEASIVVTETNEVMVFGTGNRGELGLGRKVINIAKPERIGSLPNDKIVDIAACMGHVVVVYDSGEVWGWGSGRKGQLGEPREDSWEPRKISISFKAMRAVCGREFTYIVGTADEGTHIVLGSDKWGVRSSAPVTVTSWSNIGASWGSILVLFTSGRMIAWGRDDHGQLPPDSLPDIEQIAVGSEHAIAKTTSGEILAWGWGEHGNVGTPTESLGNVKRRYNRLDCPGRPIMLGAGCATSWIYASDEQE